MVAVAHTESLLHNSDDVENFDPKTSIPSFGVVPAIAKKLNGHHHHHHHHHQIELAVDSENTKTVIRHQQQQQFENDSSPSPSDEFDAEKEKEEFIRVDQEDIIAACNKEDHNVEADEEEDRLVMDENGDLKIADEAPLTTKNNCLVQGQVVIYESGKPILKVESGTTLEVVKLLYESENNHESCVSGAVDNIIGVRPRSATNGGIPCIVTLKDSKLEENAYDVITKEKRISTPQVNNRQTSPSSLSSPDSNSINNESCASTARCIECSRESWKTKRYTNVGMNTEISINPSIESDATRTITSGVTKQNTKSSQSTQSDTPPPPKRGRPPLNRQQQNYNNSSHHHHPKEYMMAAPIPGMPASSSSVSHEMADFRHHYRRASPRTTSPLHVYGHSKMYPPLPPQSVVEPRAVDLDSVPYESIRSIHHPLPIPSHPHHSRRLSPPLRMVKMEQADRHSPPMRSQRSRSPIFYKNGGGGGYGREEVPLYYHPSHIKPEEGVKRRRVSPRYYPYEMPPPPPPGAMLIAQPPPPPTHHHKAHRVIERERSSPPHHVAPASNASSSPSPSSKDQEPTVYVLPEGFDLEKDPFDPVSMVTNDEDSKGSTESNHTTSDKKPLPISAIASNVSSPKSPQTLNRQSPVSMATATSPPKPSVVSTVDERRPPLEEGGAPGEHKLSCKICKQSFPTKSTLYKHLRGHTSDEKPFKCNECGQGFTLSSNLRQHRIIHRGYKPFQCEYCGKKFMRSNVYKQHRRIHTGEQMHKCDLCPSEFLQKYALVKHLKKVHNIETYDN